MTSNDGYIPTGVVSGHAALVSAIRNDPEAFFERVFWELNPNTSYRENWHVSAIIHALERCRRGEVKKLAILLPPRQLKSTIVSVALPAYILGQNPSAKIICASYGQQLAIDLSNNTRKMLNTPWYQQAFPNTRIGDQDTQTKFSTTKGGYRLATTPGGSMTGIGADYIILDDPQKASDMMHESSRNDTKFWIDNTVYSRFNDPKKGILIVVMQRLHDDDLIGHILQTNSGWEVIKIPIMAEEDLTFQISDNTTHTFKKGEFLQPELFGQKEFDELRASMGTANFYSQYQQSPVPPAGNIFDWKWFRPALSPPEYSEVIISLDVAATKAGGNYSAFTIWGHRDGNWYLNAVHRYQYELPDVRARLLELDKLHRPDLIVVDGVGVGLGVVQELRRQGVKYIYPAAGGGKLVDAELVAPVIEGGRVFYLPDAPGLAAFRNEVVAFPKGVYTDQVDSMVQVLKWEDGVLRMARQHKRPERKDISSPPTLNISVKKIYEY